MIPPTGGDRARGSGPRPACDRRREKAKAGSLVTVLITAIVCMPGHALDQFAEGDDTGRHAGPLPSLRPADRVLVMQEIGAKGRTDPIGVQTGVLMWSESGETRRGPGQCREQPTPHPSLARQHICGRDR
jgi:hypothetical protein